MLEAWVQGMKIIGALLVLVLFFVLLGGIVGADGPRQRREGARASLIVLMSFALIPVWPLVVMGGLGYGTVKLVKTADPAGWLEERERERKRA